MKFDKLDVLKINISKYFLWYLTDDYVLLVQML